MDRYDKNDNHDNSHPNSSLWEMLFRWNNTDPFDLNESMSDSTIKNNVSDSILDEPRISSSDRDKIDIDVREGVVIFTGVVRNLRTKQLVHEIAYWSSGVDDVVNKLKVNPRVKHKNRAGKK